MRLSAVCSYRKTPGYISGCRPGNRLMLGSVQGILRAAPHNSVRFLPQRGISHFPPLRMRLIQFKNPTSAGRRIGLELDGGKVIDLNAFDPSLPCGMKEFLEGGDTTLQIAKRALDSGQHILSRSQLSILAPITNPEKVICVGMNYVDHCLEQHVPVPKEPIIFSKFPSSIVGPYDSIILPAESQEVDWEVELAFVIGKKGKNIKEQDALEHVAGFTVAHDVSARDWQMKKNGKQWLLGKTFDTFCPIGPALVTKDSISDPHSLGIRCRVNGKLVQDSNTNQMVFKTEALIAWVSKFVTLNPGDVFLTGTPPGVGVFRNPPVYLKCDCAVTEAELEQGEVYEADWSLIGQRHTLLCTTPSWSKAGDVVECEIDELGVISNPVV